MRAYALLLVMLLAAMPANAQPANTNPEIIDVKLFVVDSAGSATATNSFDIVGDHGKTIAFEVTAKDSDFGDSISLVELYINTGAGTLAVYPAVASRTPANCENQPGTACTETWFGGRQLTGGNLAVDDRRLMVGDYPVELRVFDTKGGMKTCEITNGHGVCSQTLSVPDVKITWASQSSTALTADLRNIAKVNNAYPDQTMGVGAKLSVDVKLGKSTAVADQIPYALRHVQYRNSYNGTTTPLGTLTAPYVLGGNQLVQGHQDVTIIATDRAGRTATINVHAFVDTLAPMVVPTIPSVTYQNVSFPIKLEVADALPYTATVIVGDDSKVLSGSTTSPVGSFDFTVLELGQSNILVQVQDQLGNQFLQQFNVTTVQATTDSTIQVQVGPAHPLPEEEVTVSFTAQQLAGVTDLPFDIALSVSGHGEVFADNVLVEKNKPYKFSFGRTYLPGQYTYNASIMAIEGVNETALGNQYDEGSFEVFLGKVIAGDKEWYIRAGDFGDPVAAVTTVGKAYNLTAADRGTRTVYEFTADSKTYFWDPFQRITNMTAESSGDPDKDSPGASAVLFTVALLGVALLARRRM